MCECGVGVVRCVMCNVYLYGHLYVYVCVMCNVYVYVYVCSVYCVFVRVCVMCNVSLHGMCTRSVITCTCT